MAIHRRTIFLAAAASVVPFGPLAFAAEAVTHDLPALSWSPNALDPVISSRTIGIHYGKHHKGYLENLNRFQGGALALI